MTRRTMLLLTALVVAVLGLQGPVAPPPAHAATSPTLELHLERPVWKLKERMVVTGRLTSGDRPIVGVPVRVGVNGLLDETPYQATTQPDGSYRLEFWVEDWWGFGGHTLTAWFPGDADHRETTASTIFQVAPDQVAPVTLTVDPPLGPFDPGQQVQLTGTLRNDRNEPVAGHSILAVTDPALDARAFGKVADDGTWMIDFTVPSTAGQWSEAFPDYPVAVVFEGDWWLAPARQDVVLTLTSIPAQPTPSAAPTPRATQPAATTPAAPTPAAPTQAASPTPSGSPTAGPDLSAAPPQGSMPVWLPDWVASPVFQLSVFSFLALLLGATFIAHARRG